MVEYGAWRKLQQLHSSKASNLVLKDLFAADSSRFTNHSLSFTSSTPSVSILLDYSKNLIDNEVLAALFELAREANVEQFRDDMFSGKHINTSEGRAVLHIALRNPLTSKGGWDIKEPGAGDEVNAVLAHMKEFSDSVRSGAWRGYTGKAINTIVNIGIGGSDLGPVMVCGALKHYSKRDMKMHFVSNIDGTDMAEVLQQCDPETTLFIVASKTFTTQETITNAESAKDWFLKTASDVSHQCTVSQQPSDALRNRTLPNISSPSPPIPRGSPPSGSPSPTCSSSGTGSAVAIPSGPLLVSPSASVSVTTTSRRCSTGHTRWTSTSSRRSLRRICR